MNKPSFSAPEIVAYLKQRGHDVAFRRGQLVILPEPSEDLRERVDANQDKLIAHLRSLLPLANEHAYTVAVGMPVELRRHGVCIACGIPWRSHGEPESYAFQLVDDPERVAMIDARPVPLLAPGAAA